LVLIFSVPHFTTDCQALTNQLNGVVTTADGTTYLKEAEYTCNTGYLLVGSSKRVCQANGEWSGLLPTCAKEEGMKMK